MKHRFIIRRPLFFEFSSFTGELIGHWLQAMIVALFKRLGACAEGVGLLVAATVLCCCDILFRMIVNLSKLLRAARISRHCRDLNCWTAAITKKHRNVYERTYPTILVQSDGSSINVDYHQPRKIITLPLDLSGLTEEERKARIERRKPKSKVKIVQELDDDFDESRYLKILKKR